MSTSTLSDRHRAELLASGIAPELIEASGIHSAQNGDVRTALGWQPQTHQWGDGFLIPFRGADGADAGYTRVKLDHPRTSDAGKVFKYESPLKASNRPYFPPGFLESWNSLADGAHVVVTEGEKKALSLASAGYVGIGLVGVYGWCAPRQKVNGSAAGRKELMPDLAALDWKGRRVAIVFDSDAAQKKQVRTASHDLARALIGAGAVVRLVALPDADDGSKVGVDDFLVAHGREALDVLIASAAEIDPATVGDEVLFGNTLWRVVVEGGEVKRKPMVKPLPQILAELDAATGGWPRRIGQTLFFDHDRRIVFTEKPPALFAMLKTAGAIQWRGGSDSSGACYLQREELFEALGWHAREYAAVSDHPYEPRRSDVYTSWRAPEGYDADGQYLDDLLSRFCPSTELDGELIRALLLTMVWGGECGTRPLFVVTTDATGSQEVGKSTMVRALASVVGGTVEPLDLGGKRNTDDLGKVLVSASSLPRRVVLIDNAEGMTRSDMLAELLTAQHIDGRPAFGRQTRRENLITWCMTSNDAALSTDLASRAVVLRLRMPDRDVAPGWDDRLFEFINEHRNHVLADCIHALRGKRHPITAGRNRFVPWCDQVLALSPRVNEILLDQAANATVVDAEIEEVELVIQEIDRRIASADYAEALRADNITPKDLGEVWLAATGVRLGTGWVIRRLNHARKRGKLTGLQPVGTKHGSAWQRVGTGGEA